MAVTPRDILDAAAVMATGQQEIDWRNACSRSYFAAFHRCRGIAEGLEPHADTAGREAHKTVSDILGNWSHGSWAVGLGYKLDQCRKLRNEADYDIERGFSYAECRSAIETSEAILATVVPSDSARPPDRR